MKILTVISFVFIATACSTTTPVPYQNEVGCFTDQIVKAVYDCNAKGCKVSLNDGTFAQTSEKKIKRGDQIAIVEQCSNIAH